MSKETHTSRGVLVRLEVSDDVVVIRYGNLLLFKTITSSEKNNIERMVDSFGVEDTVNNIFRTSSRMVGTVA